MLSYSAPLFVPKKGAGIVSDPPRKPVSVFLKCRKCGTRNCFDDIPITRVDLAMFRGSGGRVKCRECGAQMDTMGAYCGVRVGVEIKPRADPRK
jgi:hypothetical protein